jgi:hypothetical protein
MGLGVILSMFRNKTFSEVLSWLSEPILQVEESLFMLFFLFQQINRNGKRDSLANPQGSLGYETGA